MYGCTLASLRYAQPGFFLKGAATPVSLVFARGAWSGVRVTSLYHWHIIRADGIISVFTDPWKG